VLHEDGGRVVTAWSHSLALGITHAALEAWEENRQAQIAADQAKLRAHVRTGGYRGTITRTIRGLQRELPRAEVLCGGEATGKDHAIVGAKQIIRDRVEPWLSDMCPACRAKIEASGARDLSHLPGRRSTATPKQCGYLRALLDEGARAGRPHLFDARAIDQMSSREASAKIDDLKAMKARGWKEVA
jgi:hypothetical protein